MLFRSVKELLELLASLQIEGAVKEMQKQLESKEGLNPQFMAQVTALLKHHEVKADIREVEDLNDIKARAIKANQALLDSVNKEDEDVEYVN